MPDNHDIATVNRKGLLAKLSGGASDVLLGDGTFGAFSTLLAGLTRFKVGSFTYDVSTASGTQAVTGVGFSPKAVVFLAGINGTSAMSAGIDDGSTAFVIIDDNVDAAGTYAVNSQSIGIATTAGGNAQGKITTLGADGFTITWTKTGSPTGTATIGYLALR